MCIRDSSNTIAPPVVAGVIKVLEILSASTDRRDKLEKNTCLLYTSDAADERSSVDLGGRRIIKKKNRRDNE